LSCSSSSAGSLYASVLAMAVVELESTTGTASISCDAFIAESSTPGSFGRRNYFGVNWGRTLLVPSFPYTLQVSFVIVLRVPAGRPVENLSASLSGPWGDAFSHHLGSIPARDQEKAQVAEWSKLALLLPKPADLRLDVTFEEFARTFTWNAQQGPGPMRRGTTVLPGSSVLDGQASTNPLVQLANEVRASLMIADQYATPDFMRAFLPRDERAWRCRLIISERACRKSFAEWISLGKEYPNLEVRGDDLIHDRFVIRDDEEGYAFGHSLKDLDRGRVSFFSRVYDLEQFRLISEAMMKSWERGCVILSRQEAG
jgi:hypothetical protein